MRSRIGRVVGLAATEYSAHLDPVPSMRLTGLKGIQVTRVFATFNNSQGIHARTLEK